MRFERRIGRDDDDDGACWFATQFITLEMETHGDAEDRAFRPLPEIRLDEGADRIDAPCHFHDPRCGSVTALEVVADHAGTATDAALLDGSAARALERLNHVRGLHMETIDVTKIAVIGL